MQSLTRNNCFMRKIGFAPSSFYCNYSTTESGIFPLQTYYITATKCFLHTKQMLFCIGLCTFKDSGRHSKTWFRSIFFSMNYIRNRIPAFHLQSSYGTDPFARLLFQSHISGNPLHCLTSRVRIAVAADLCYDAIDRSSFESYRI